MTRRHVPAPLSLLLVALLPFLSAGPLVPAARAEDYFSADPSPLTFPDQAVNTTSSSKTITFRNVSTGGKSVGTPTVTGDFAIVAEQSTCPSTNVDLDAYCTITLTFSPQQEGARTGTLTVYNSYEGANTFVLTTVALQGTGTGASPANITASPNLVAFGDRALSSTGDALSVVFTNSGGTAATLGTAYAAVVSGGESNEFYTGSTTRLTTLDPSASCIIDVYFSPRNSLGARTGVLILPDNNNSPLISVPLSGNAFSAPPPTPTVNATFAPTVAKNGTTVTLNATTSADVRCLVVAGDHSATLTDPDGKTSWAREFTAGPGDGARGVSVTAYRSVDCTGTGGTASPAPTYLLDNTPPITTHNAPNGPQSAACVTVTLTPTDIDGSGVATTAAILDNGTPTVGTSVLVTGDGDHTLMFWSTDIAGNIEGSTTIQIRLDQTLPTISHTQSPAPNADGWNNGDVTITFTCTDAPGSSTSTVASCTTPQTVTTGGANQPVTGTAIDTAGNSAQTTATVNIDKTAPTVTGTPTTAPNEVGWYKDNVTVAWSCADSLSDLVTPCLTTGTITGEGLAQDTTVMVSDRAGNSTRGASAAVKIDRTAPTTTATPDRALPPGGVYSGAVTVTLAATDLLSGLASINYTLDSGMTQVYNAPISLTNDGTYIINYWSIDLVGNVETEQTLTIIIGSNLITFAQPSSPQVYGAAPLTLGATASSGLPVSYTTSGPCQIDAQTNTLTLIGAGTCEVTATQAGDASHPPAMPVARTIVINPAPLTVRAADQSRPYTDSTALVCTFTYNGLVNNESAATVLSGQPSCSTAATAASPAGAYPLVTALDTLSVIGDNYALITANGTLTITPATVTISVVGGTATAGGTNATLTATAQRAAGDSGNVPDGTLITFTVFNNQPYSAVTSGGVATVNVPLGNIGAGTYPIEVSFAGDANHAASSGNGTLMVAAPSPSPSSSPSPSPTPSPSTTPSPSPSASPTLTLVPVPPTQGSVQITREGDRATLTANQADGQLFLGWKVNGAAVTTWANPFTLTLTADTTIEATFAPRQTFADAGPDQTGATEAIAQLAARGIIRGCDPAAGLFCPTDTTLRAQMAALIVRAMGWGGENPANPFTDRAGVDDELWRAIAILADHGVANGYGDGAYGTADSVLNAQVISFITRAMVDAGHWQFQPDDDRVYPNVGADSGHRIDLVTYAHYAGPVRGTTSTTEAFSGWDQPASRAWFAFAL
jgi:hypothetical protein